MRSRSETTRRLMLIKSHMRTIAGILALALLLAGAIGTTALAVSADSGSPPPAASQPQDAHGSRNHNAAAVPDDENEAVKAVLASEAKVTEAEALSIAEAAHPGYTFKAEELDSENGAVCYELRGSNQSGGVIEVEVNAVDGTILAESEGENEG